MVLSIILSILTKDMPMGDGLCGDLVAKTPVFKPFNRGGITLALVCVESFRWKWKSILETKHFFVKLLVLCSVNLDENHPVNKEVIINFLFT